MYEKLECAVVYTVSVVTAWSVSTVTTLGWPFSQELQFTTTLLWPHFYPNKGHKTSRIHHEDIKIQQLMLEKLITVTLSGSGRHIWREADAAYCAITVPFTGWGTVQSPATPAAGLQLSATQCNVKKTLLLSIKDLLGVRSCLSLMSETCAVLVPLPATYSSDMQVPVMQSKGMPISLPVDFGKSWKTNKSTWEVISLLLLPWTRLIL